MISHVSRSRFWLMNVAQRCGRVSGNGVCVTGAFRCGTVGTTASGGPPVPRI